MNPVIILENIRSCYNVGSILRTADALWRDVAIVWYTPNPCTQPKVAKTSLGAEESVHIEDFAQEVVDGIVPDSALAIAAYKERGYTVIAAEVYENALALDQWSDEFRSASEGNKKSPLIAVIVGNEVTGVEQSTLQIVDAVVYIPMRWVKESLNVSQTAAMFMRELQ